MPHACHKNLFGPGPWHPVAYMNLNTALISHLQKPPTAPKSALIAFNIHPAFLLILNTNLLQGLQFPSPCQSPPIAAS